MVECVLCGDDYSKKRLALGYKTCLDCGETRALKEKTRKARCSAPAYNKGAYMYVSSKKMALDLGK
tara:strand:+ start:294 stop:491 length:198 start_codon:yes stop_codon:yes gene_type:complete